MRDELIITTISLSKDEELVTRKRRTMKQPNYYRIGNGTMNRFGIQSIDLLGVAISSSQSARNLIKSIKDGMTYDTYEEDISFVVHVSVTTDADKMMVKRGFKELNELDIVRRVKRGYYMLNPNAIITDYEEQIKVWNSIKLKDK